MRHGSLFSGIGGFDLAAEWMGWTNVFHCEWMEFPRKVLDYHFPNADSHIDICKTDFKKYANTIDILTGGFPCQPFSLAGKRKGTDDERYLWGEMLRAIQEIKPKFVIAENVFGITNIDGGLVFEQVCLDLENEGYEVQPFIIPACAKNAPHRRDRCWFVAFNTKSARNTEVGEICKRSDYESIGICEENGNVTDTKSKRSRGLLIGKKQTHTVNGIIGSNGDATDTNGTNNQTRSHGKILGQSHRQKTDGHSNVERTNQWENFPTQSPVCGGDDGIPTELDGITFPKWRAESIKGYGNAIVPQIAYQLFEIIQELNENN
jgi:DNA (cytosine-5)-methyltransferase 1